MPSVSAGYYEDDAHEKLEEPEEYEILIPRTKGILGVNVRKDFDENLTGLFVHSFITTSKAYEQNLLRVNDEILGVNNINVEGAELVDYISAVSRPSGDNVLLHIRRYAGNLLDFIDYKRTSTRTDEEEVSLEARIVGSVFMDGIYVPPEDEEPTPVVLSHNDEKEDDFDEYELSVPKTNGSLQINIRHDSAVDSPIKGLFVHHIDPSSNAYRQGLLHVNDQILGIDDFNVMDADLEGVILALSENKSDHVVLLLRRYNYDVWHKINAVRNSIDVNEPSISTQEVLSPRRSSPRHTSKAADIDDAAQFRLLLDNMQLEVNSLKQRLNSITTTVTAYTMEVDEMKHVLNESILTPLRTSVMTTPRTLGKTEISPIENRHAGHGDTPLVAETKMSGVLSTSSVKSADYEEVRRDSIDSKSVLPSIRGASDKSPNSFQEGSKSTAESPVLVTARSRESKYGSDDKDAGDNSIHGGKLSARSHTSAKSKHSRISDIDEATQTDFKDDERQIVPSDDGVECSPRYVEESSVRSSNRGEAIMPLVFDDASHSSHGSSICSDKSSKKSSKNVERKAEPDVTTTFPEVRRVSRPELYVKTTSLSSSQLTSGPRTDLTTKPSQLSKSMDAKISSPVDTIPQLPSAPKSPVNRINRPVIQSRASSDSVKNSARSEAKGADESSNVSSAYHDAVSGESITSDTTQWSKAHPHSRTFDILVPKTDGQLMVQFQHNQSSVIQQLVIHNVVAGSRAARQGLLQRNDVILEINGFNVKNLYFNDIQRIIQRDRDEYVLLKVMRREAY